MDLGLPFHSCTFDDIMMTSSGFRGNPIFFWIIPCFWKNGPPIKFKLCKQHKHDIREDAYSCTAGISIRDTARDTAYSLWCHEVWPFASLNHNEYAVSRAVSRMKMPSVRDYASSLISKRIRTFAFEDNCFCLQSFLPKKWILFLMFIKGALYLTKRPIPGKQKQ